MPRSGIITNAALTIAALLAAIVGAALLAPPAHELAVELGIVDPERFLRTFRRLLAAALAIAFLVAFRPWRDGGVSSYGLERGAPLFRLFAVPYAAAIGIVVLVIALQLSVGYLIVREPIDWGRVASRASRYAMAGILIGFIEELFFRGWMLRRLSASMTRLGAAALSSALYAVLHALRPKNLWVEVSNDWFGCLVALKGWILAASDLPRFGGMFLGLFLVGMLLSFLTYRTGTILPALAAHAAGVAGLYTYGTITQRIREGGLIGTNRLYDGLLFWVVVSLVAAWVGAKSRTQAFGLVRQR